MQAGTPITRWLLLWVFLCAEGAAQVTVAGRVVDETGAGVSGARVELRATKESPPIAASTDRAGNFSLQLREPGSYLIRAERLGFYLYNGGPQPFSAGAHDVTLVLNHQQDFSEHIDVVASPPVIDPQQPAEHRELDNTEIQTIPYPAPQDYRNALPMMDGIVQDNAGRAHFNGGQTSQTNYMLDGFNISDPVTGRLETRLNIDTIQSMDVQSSRFAAENGRGATGVLDLKTKMGDDRLRFAGTNFIPSISSDGGWHLNKWTPRLEVSGPIAKGRAWFHNGFDAFYSDDTVHGLPHGQNRTSGLTTSDLSRVQVNLSPGNLLTGSFLMNFADVDRLGLSFLNPAETTRNRRQSLYMGAIREQSYFANGSLLDVGFADTHGLLRDNGQGTQLFEITPTGDRGNYFANLDRHFYRQQWIANLFLPTRHLLGTHQLKFGIDFEHESFHQQNLRHDYEVLRADSSVARYVSFAGSPFQAKTNFEGAQYVQDAWSIRDGLVVEAGMRAEWNEIVRDLEVAPRFAVVWSPGKHSGTKFSAGWGLYYDAISLENISRHQDQTSLSTFFAPGNIPGLPVPTSFVANERLLRTPRSQVSSVSMEHKLPRDFFLRTGYMHRAGDLGFAWVPTAPIGPPPLLGGVNFMLSNSRRERYDAWDMSVRHTFAGGFEWFAGYSRSSARSSAAVDYSVENPVFAPQAPGPFAWDTPNRFHMWGWAPLPKHLLPRSFEFLTRNTTAAYLVEYRTGFPFGVVDEEGFAVGMPNSRRYPDYFNINLHLERQFRALHYLWAWRFGFNNLTNNGNPNVVNNVTGTPQFLTYGRGQARAFSVRLRLLGRR